MVTVNQICVISFFRKFFYSGVWLFWLANSCSPGGISEFFWPHTLRKAQGWGPVFVTTKIKDGKMMRHRVENPSSRVTILFFSEWTVKVTQLCPTLWHPMDYIYSPWNSPSQNTGVGSLSLLQQIFLTQESNQSVLHCRWILNQLNYQGSSKSKESACNAEDLGSIPGLARSAGEMIGYQPQYSCLENPMDRGPWWATVQGVTKSQTWLRDYTHIFFFLAFYFILEYSQLTSLW